jgi:hypothetical protein
LSFRFPQCVSLRDESNSRTTWRLSARIMPMRACIKGSASFRRHNERLDCGLPRLKILFGIRKLHDVVGGIAQSHELAPTW